MESRDLHTLKVLYQTLLLLRKELSMNKILQIDLELQHMEKIINRIMALKVNLKVQ